MMWGEGGGEEGVRKRGAPRTKVGETKRRMVSTKHWREGERERGQKRERGRERKRKRGVTNLAQRERVGDGTVLDPMSINGPIERVPPFPVSPHVCFSSRCTDTPSRRFQKKKSTLFVCIFLFFNIYAMCSVMNLGQVGQGTTAEAPCWTARLGLQPRPRPNQSARDSRQTDSSSPLAGKVCEQQSSLSRTY